MDGVARDMESGQRFPRISSNRWESRLKSSLDPLWRNFASLAILICLTLSIGRLMAFPPAPYYTLYGMVRDQVGQTITAEGAELILLKDGTEIGRTPISPALGLDQNYVLKVRIDQKHANTDLL